MMHRRIDGEEVNLADTDPGPAYLWTFMNFRVGFGNKLLGSNPSFATYSVSNAEQVNFPVSSIK
jgi:hypothetical protein